jgi:hypothetical protein
MGNIHQIIVTGYTYQTEQEAILDIEKCNQYYGIPESPNDVTTQVCDYNYYLTDNIYYIIYDPMLKIVLGEPSTFILTYEI